MRESDAVFLVYLPMTFFTYVLFSTRHLSTVTGRQVPRLQGFMDRCFPGPRPGIGAAFGSYLAWTAFTQATPLLVAMAETTTSYVRTVSFLEVAAAAGWTVYVLTRPAS